MITFLAPASRCLAAFSRSVNSPVDSITTSAPTSPQGSAPGSRSANTFSSLPSTTRPLSVASTVPLNGPRIESYLSRCASVFVVGDVVDADPVDVGAARVRRAEDVATDAAEAVDSGPQGHPSLSSDRVAEYPTGGRGIYYGVRGGLSMSRCTTSTSRSALPAYTRARCSAITTDRWRPPVQPMPDREVRLALLLVGRQQVVEQRHQVTVELGDPVGRLPRTPCTASSRPVRSRSSAS